MAKLRVLLLTHELSRTGAPKLVLETLQELRGEVLVQTVALDGGPLADSYRELGSLGVLNSTRPTGRGWRITAPGAFVRRWHGLVSTARALAQRPDVIYMNSVASVPLLRYVRLPDRPVLLHVHESEVALAPYVITHRKAVTQLPDRYVVVSETLRDTLVERHGIAADRIVVIPAFIRASDLEPFRLANAGEPLPVVPADGRPLVVGGAGSVHWAKGVELWLLVARELVDRLGEGRVRFVWTGIRDDQEGRRFRAMSHLLGLDGTVEFVPETPEPYGHVAGVDIFALTSWEDSWPRVVLEAMYLERPVVCFAGGGGAPAEVGDAGVVVPGFRPVDMAAAIQRLAASPEERLRLGLLAHARVVEHYTSATAIPQLASEIRALAASRTPLPLSAA